MSKSSFPYAGRRWKLARNAYDFFQDVEKEGRAFSLQELCEVTHYSMVTARSYLNKCWQQFVQKRPQGDFICQGLLAVSWERFAHLHSQKRSLNEGVFHAPVVSSLSSTSPSQSSRSWFLVVLTGVLKRIKQLRSDTLPQ